MIKLGVNQAQDIAGLTAHIRGNVGIYGSYSASRDDPGALFNFKKLAEEKQLAPIKGALMEETYYWTRTATRDKVGERGNKGKL